jgi:integrase
MKRTRYTRTAAGEYSSRITHPLDPRKRIHLVGGTAHELEARRAFIKTKEMELELGIITEQQFAAFLRGFDRRKERAELETLWRAYEATCSPDHAGKIRSIWRSQLMELFAGELALDLTAQKMSRWERWMREPLHVLRHKTGQAYSPKTVQDTFGHLTAALRAAIPEQLEALPWTLANGKLWKPRAVRPEEARERPACGTVEELELLVRAALEHDKALRARGLFADNAERVAVVALLALRNGEGSGLAWDDLTLEGERPRARIRHQAVDQWRTHYPGDRPRKAPKGRRERALALHPTALVALLAQRELLEARGWYRPDGPVFPSPSGPFEGTWRNNANCITPEVFKRYAKAAGFPNWETWVPHSLRHSAATLEGEAGASLRSIQGRTGHSSLTNLEAYIHARTGRGLVPSAIRALAVRFDEGEDDGATEPA